MSGLVLPVVPVPVRALRLRYVAAGCSGVAALVVLVGSFLPVYTGSLTAGGETATLAITSWGLDVDNGEPYGAAPASGYLLVFATGLLVAATVLCAMAGSATATPGTSRVAGVTTVAATAFLTGAVWAIGMEVLGYAESFRPTGAAAFDDSITSEHGPGVGIWVLLGSVVVALADMVLVLLSTRSTAPIQPDPPTPRHGFPVPVQPYPPPNPWSPPPAPPPPERGAG